MSVAASRSPAHRRGSHSVFGRNRLVRAWLVGLAILVVAMVAVGGATRLTGSGLSITEWRPVTGAVPPLTDAGWAGEFAKYRASSQYQNLNQGMDLAGFKSIYWWEWSHRQLGRFIGLFFALPLAWFYWTGAVTGAFALGLLGIGALGGLQAAVGWIMVASGLQPGMTAVAPVKLSLHLLVASLILSLLVMVATRLGRSVERPGTVARGAAVLPPLLLALVFVQIGLGGLVAGAKAGLTYNTWPLMDGQLVPSSDTLFVARPWIENFVDNPALVQFDHRLVGYAVVVVALVQAWLWRGPGSVRALIVAAVALLQVVLGITTLLLAVPVWAGLSHQLLAMGLLAAATVHAVRSAGAGAARPVPLRQSRPLPAAGVAQPF